MPAVKTVHRRRSTITVEAHGEVLFTGFGPVGRWTKELVQAIETATAGNAPRNSRPRWSHYGKPLKQTFGSSVRARPDQLKVHGAVGSSSDHATYVDQGTGVFGGGGAYEAKILPPWRRNSPSLYEQGWSPNASGARSTVMIQGQRGQFFFDKGIKQGFAIMRILSFEAPSNPKIEEAIRTLPLSILSFLDSGNTVANPAFKTQLAEWRLWRQEAFNEGRRFGKRKGRFNSRPGRRYVKRPKRRKTAADRQHEREMNRARQQRYRDRKKVKSRKRDPVQAKKQRDRQRFAMIAISRYPAAQGYNVDIQFVNGAWTAVVTKRGKIVKTLVSSVKF